MAQALMLALLLQGTPSEEMFKKVQAQLDGAGSYKVKAKVKVEMAGSEEKGEATIDVCFKAPNKVRCDIKMDALGRFFDGGFVCDGKKVRVRSERSAEEVKDVVSEAPPSLGSNLLSALSRVGTLSPVLMGKLTFEGKNVGVGFDARKDLSIGGIKFGPEEQVDDNKTRRIDYTVKIDSTTLECRVWVELQTLLPIKRTVRFQSGKWDVTLTELYGSFELNGDMDDEPFALKKEE